MPEGAAGNDGREESSSACFATCQNVAFNCKAQRSGKTVAFTAEMAFEMPGCKGSLSEGTVAKPDTAVKLAVDCLAKKVCVGATPGADPTTCGAGTFSAFSFSFTPAEGAVTCTRE